MDLVTTGRSGAPPEAGAKEDCLPQGSGAACKGEVFLDMAIWLWP